MGNRFMFWVILLSLSLVEFVYGQACLRVRKRGLSPPSDDPPFNDDNNLPLPANNAVQAIITTYGLFCDCVNITSWETYVQPGGRNQYLARGYDVTFQVWRPSPTVQDDGCYSLVGENVFTSFTFSEGGLVQLTPTPPSNSIITAQSGDVVGYYTNSRSGDDEGIQLERDQDYNENIIWFLSVAEGSLTSSGDNTCPYPVGTGRYLSSSTGAAPMLRIRSTTVSCPPSPPPVPLSTLSQLELSSTPFIDISTTVLVAASSIYILPTLSNSSMSGITASSTRVLEISMPPVSPHPTTGNSNGAPNSNLIIGISVLPTLINPSVSGVIASSTRVLEINTSLMSPQPTTGMMATINNLQTLIHSSMSGATSSRVFERNTSHISSLTITEISNGRTVSTVMATINLQKTLVSSSQSTLMASSTIELEIQAPMAPQPTPENSDSALNSTAMVTISVLAITTFISIFGLTLIFVILISRKIKKNFATNKVVFRGARNLSNDLPIDQIELQYEVIDTDIPTTTEDYSTVAQVHNTPCAMMSNEAYAVHRNKIDDTPLVMMTNAAYAVHKRD